MIFLTLKCACGKKDWDYHDAETLSKEEEELLAMQTTQDSQRQTA